MFRALPDIRDDVGTIVIEGDRAGVRFASSSRTPGFYLMLMTFFRFRGGRIIEDDTIFNTSGRASVE
jgi:hypothetical protein